MEQYVYIHGVVADRDRTTGHTEDCRTIRDGIDEALCQHGGGSLPAISDSVTIEWGSDTDEATDTRTLAAAQASSAAGSRLPTRPAT